MASFDSPKSRRSPEPRISPTSDFRASNVKKSRQQGFTGTGVRKERIDKSQKDSASFTGVQREVGNQVRIGVNTKGTDTLKNPLNAYQRKVMAPAENPDGKLSRSTTYSQPVAAKRGSPTGRTRL